jgi:hypothetical protein
MLVPYYIFKTHPAPLLTSSALRAPSPKEEKGKGIYFSLKERGGDEEISYL